MTAVRIILAKRLEFSTGHLSMADEPHQTSRKGPASETAAEPMAEPVMTESGG